MVRHRVHQASAIRRLRRVGVALLVPLLLLVGCSTPDEPVEPDGEAGEDTSSDDLAEPDDDADDGGSSDEADAGDRSAHDLQVFFTNTSLGDAGQVYPVARTTTDDDLPAAALRALLAGPTAEERDEGYSSWFSAETAGLLRSVRIDDGTAKVDLDGRLPTVIPNASTSAGSLTLLAELDATLEQFDEVSATEYALDGDVAAFYEWLQLAPPAGAQAAGEAVVQVYFPNTERGDPGEVFAVDRTVPTPEVLRGALTALLAGPTAEEVEQGYESWFSSDTAGLLTDVRLDDGTAHVDLDPQLATVIPGASSSAGSASLLASLDATALDFPTVDEVVYSFDGDVAAFYGWLQREAPEG